MKWSATSSSAPCPAMTEMSVRRQRRSDSAAARCIAGYKNTDWNETLDVRTSHPASGAGGGIARLADCADSPLEWPVFLANRMDADVSYRESVGWVRAFLAAPRRFLPANAIESSFGDARAGFLVPRARRSQRRRPRRSHDGSECAERNAAFAAIGSARSDRAASSGDGRNRRRDFHV